ncbi:MAG: type II secretion system F family protein [Lachnospiraceae bacterium]|nr:type II secretion system F family protein [Candidatus Colinaster equi]
MITILNKLTMNILKVYEKICDSKGWNLYPGRNERILSGLSPGKRADRLAQEYYVNKIQNVIKILFAGILLAAIIFVSQLTGSNVDEDGRIPRRNYGAGDYLVELQAASDDYSYGKMEVDVKDKKYSLDETQEKMGEVYDKMATYILGENDSLKQVTENLNLPTTLDTYPFEIRWESSDYNILDTSGCINNTQIEPNGVDVTLTMILIYDDFTKEYLYNITVLPPILTEEEIYKKQLLDAISVEDDKSRINDYLQLPLNVNNKSITWKECKPPTVWLIIVMTLCTCVCIWKAQDVELQKEWKERERELSVDYSEFVSKLQLLLSSGMTLRSAFERIGADYEKQRKNCGKKRYLYEEVLLCNRKLQDGVSESKCYEYLGKRCGTIYYKKLSSLLVQNLKKGNDGLICALESEIKIAFSERKASAIRSGEEAQTKLLFPMILMLSVSMIIIMIPAYLSFGGM